MGSGARRLGFERLYMWTEHKPAVYARYGYKALFPAQWHGRAITVMAKELA
ncbi:MAG TPA: hypothetical protein VMV79_06645 [Alphaproteobacteria bacterium]|nr:hypothetical protein [Alphaproteobacteria bacterium]